MIDIPLFPLPAVLFPDETLPLQIFEPRYLRMVKDSLKTGQGLVLVQSMPDQEPKVPTMPFYSVGCYGEIVDWNPLPNDLLGIELKGQRKVKIYDFRREHDNLYIGQCEYLPDEAAPSIAEKHQLLVQLLKDLQKHPMVETLGLDINYSNAREVSYRLASLLPFTIEEKQLLLEMDDALLRLDAIESMIRELGGQ